MAQEHGRHLALHRSKARPASGFRPGLSMQALCCSTAQAAEASIAQRRQPEVTSPVLQRSSGSRRNCAEVAARQSPAEHMPAEEVKMLRQEMGTDIQLSPET